MPKSKRNDVIQAALGIIAEKGFHNAPTSLIAERANVGMGTIYRYFKSKDVLIHAIYSERLETIKEFLLADYDPTRSLKQRYIQLCSKFLEYLSNSPVDLAFFEQYRNSPYSLMQQEENIQGFMQGENPEHYPLLKLFSEGQDLKVIKNLKLSLLVELTTNNIFALARHLQSEEQELTEIEINLYYEACWDAVST